jgi:transposase-like protein
MFLYRLLDDIYMPKAVYMQKKQIYNTACDCLKNNIEYRPKQKVEKTMEFDFRR